MIVYPQDQDGQSPLVRVGQIFALLAGVATLVYVSGGAILSLRLDRNGLASEAVVSNLPREFLISIGLTEVVLPLLLVGVSLVALMFLLVNVTNMEEAGRALTDWKGARQSERVMLVLAFGLLFAGGIVLAVRQFESSWQALAFVPATVSVLFVGGQVVRNRFERRLASLGAVAWTGVLLAGCLTPWLVAVAQDRHHLLRATVCDVDGNETDGSLIGETADRIYVGESRREAAAQGRKPRIKVIPRARLTEVFIGGPGQCPSQRSGSPSNALGGGKGSGPLLGR